VAGVGGAPAHDVRAELRSLIVEWNADLPVPVDDDTCLISSGAFDSLALFKLCLWVEEKTGRRIDPSTVDLAREWDSVRLILQYLQHLPSPAVREAPLRPAHASPGIQIVRYAAQYKSAIAELQKTLWSPDTNLNLKYFEWKYLQNPYGSDPKVYLALVHGEIVGMRGFYPSRWESGVPAQVEDVLVADDLNLRADCRNKGLVNRIMREALDDLAGCGTDYVFNLSGGRLTVLGQFAMAWRSPGDLAPVERGSRGHALRSALRKKWATLPYSWRHKALALLANKQAFRHLDRSLGVLTADSGVAVSVAADPRPSAMARLVASQRYDGRLRHVRDDAYFLWRLRNPLHQYRFFYVGDESLEGYLVAKCSNQEVRLDARMRIVDMEARDEQVASALLEAIIRVGRADELVVWSRALDPRFRHLLSKFRFEPVDRERAPYDVPRILLRSIDDAKLAEDWRINGVRLLDLENWDLRMLYTMAG
jgi:acyl carrier protein